jgi:glutathione S-transferase
MITLRQPPAAWGLPNMSPFCVKLETYLRMANIEYRVKGADIKKAPKGRVPYIEVDGIRMGDTTLIIDYLKKKHGDHLDSELTEEQKALSLAVQSMVEERLYFAVAWLRWSDEKSFAYVREVFLKVFPPVIGHYIVKVIRKSFFNIVRAQGMGQHTREEIVEFAKRDLKSLSVLLGDRTFFNGEKPTTIDATLYGFLVHGMWVPWDNEVKEYTLSLKNLEAYCLRMEQRYWPGYRNSDKTRKV